jgi:hypothetical protein
MKKTMYPQTPPPNMAKTTQPLNSSRTIKANMLRRYISKENINAEVKP